MKFFKFSNTKINEKNFGCWVLGVFHPIRKTSNFIYIITSMNNTNEKRQK